MGNHPLIAVVGSSNTDMVITASSIPKPGETVVGNQLLMNQGGKGANQAVAAARLGGQVSFVGRVGGDIFGEQAEDIIGNFGIDTQFLHKDASVSTGVALITIDKNGQNAITVAPGANSNVSPHDVDLAKEVLASAKLILTQFEIPKETVWHLLDIAQEVNTPVLVNPAPLIEGFLPVERLGQATILTPNEHEAAALVGFEVNSIETAQKAARFCLDRGVKVAVITLGSRGAVAVTEEESWFQPTFPVLPVDTVAAGDTFSGAFAVAWAESLPLKRCLKVAAAAAALSITRQGAQQAIPFRHEVVELMQQHAEITPQAL